MNPKMIGNERGVVFITVLMIMMVMMVLAISMISVNVGQVMISERQVKRLQAEMVATGALSRYFSSRIDNGSPPGPYLQSIDGQQFSVSFTSTAPDQVNINVAY